MKTRVITRGPLRFTSTNSKKEQQDHKSEVNADFSSAEPYRKY